MDEIVIDENELIELRLQGLTYAEISCYFKNHGKNVSTTTIRNKLSNIYGKKGEQIPRVSCKKKKIIELNGEEIFELREQGKTYKEITTYLREKRNKSICFSCWKKMQRSI